MASDRTYAVGMSGASYTGLWSVQKSEVGKYMLSSRALPQSSGGAFVMNITPRYELVRRDPLGEGSYGSVWLCQERDVCAAATESAGDKVANAGRPQAPAANRQKPRLVVKCVAYMSNGEECRRMLREVCLMSTMNHPHVSSAVDAWTWKPPGVQPLQLCVVSPFGGCSLAAFLCKFNSANPLPEETARSIMQQLAAATCYLHSVAIIHRDIKSENVLVEEKPNGQVTVRLIDFGLARVLAPMQASPVADAAETSDQVPSKSSAESGVEDDGEHDNEEEEEEGEGEVLETKKGNSNKKEELKQSSAKQQKQEQHSQTQKINKKEEVEVSRTADKKTKDVEKLAKSASAPVPAAVPVAESSSAGKNTKKRALESSEPVVVPAPTKETNTMKAGVKETAKESSKKIESKDLASKAAETSNKKAKKAPEPEPKLQDEDSEDDDEDYEQEDGEEMTEDEVREAIMRAMASHARLPPRKPKKKSIKSLRMQMALKKKSST